MSEITFPDFKTTGFYYYEILEDLIRYKRIYLPELTDEDPHEPTIQMLRAFALSAHLNSCDIDLWAKETFFTTAELRASVDAQLHLIADRLAQASPASVALLVKFSRKFPAATTTVPARSVFATEATATVEAIEYENLEEETTARSDQMSAVWAVEAGVAADDTVAANAPANWIPWATPAVGDMIYFGHDDLFFDDLSVVVVAPGSDLTGVWEFHDGNWYDDAPDSVTNLGATLRMSIEGLLGDPASTRAGLRVRVTYNRSGAYEDVTSTFAGGANVVTTTGFLGQTVPSTDPADYTVGTLWHEVDLSADTILDWTVAGTKHIAITPPWSSERLWTKGIITDAVLGDHESCWLRYRIVAVGGAPTSPTLERTRIDQGKLYQLLTIYQGRTREDDPLGTSDGSASQSFTVTRYPVIDDDTLSFAVSALDWARQDNLLSSDALAEHFEVDFDDDGRASVTFGDGTNGKIPPGASIISSRYRTLKEGQNGNVGAGMIIVNRSGAGWIESISNPQAAVGYAAREGSTKDDLAKAKRVHPARLRSQERAVTAPDVEALVTDWIDPVSGSSPIARVLTIEEGYGPKTIEAVCVAKGGGALAPGVLDDIEEYFNGVTGDPTHRGRVLLNSQLVATNYVAKTVNVTATVTGGNAAAIETVLRGYLDPEALDDGTPPSYRWAFGATVFRSALIALIFAVPGVRNVTIATPGIDVVLASRELPKAGTLTITVI